MSDNHMSSSHGSAGRITGNNQYSGLNLNNTNSMAAVGTGGGSGQMTTKHQMLQFLMNMGFGVSLLGLCLHIVIHPLHVCTIILVVAFCSITTGWLATTIDFIVYMCAFPLHNVNCSIWMVISNTHCRLCAFSMLLFALFILGTPYFVHAFVEG